MRCEWQLPVVAALAARTDHVLFTRRLEFPTGVRSCLSKYGPASPRKLEEDAITVFSDIGERPVLCYRMASTLCVLLCHVMEQAVSTLRSMLPRCSAVHCAL